MNGACGHGEEEGNGVLECEGGDFMLGDGLGGWHLAARVSPSLLYPFLSCMLMGEGQGSPQNNEKRRRRSMRKGFLSPG